MSKVKHDGWCMKYHFPGKHSYILFHSFQLTKTEVIEWWNNRWTLNTVPQYEWKKFRKRGTHTIVKVRIIEVNDEQ